MCTTRLGGHHWMSVPGGVPSRGCTFGECTRHNYPQKGPGTRHAQPHPRGQNDKHLWKHYLLITSLTGDNNFGLNYQVKFRYEAFPSPNRNRHIAHHEVLLWGCGMTTNCEFGMICVHVLSNICKMSRICVKKFVENSAGKSTLLFFFQNKALFTQNEI